MLNNDDVRNNIDDLVDLIKQFWKYSVSNIHVANVTDIPYDMFTLTMTLYDKYDITMDYDRSTISIKVNVNSQYTVLSKLTDEKVYKGFESCDPDNLQHNFKVLDMVLRAMD